MRNGALVRCLGASAPVCLSGCGFEYRSARCVVAEVPTLAKTILGVTGRCNSIVGQSLLAAAEIAGPLESGSCAGQCSPDSFVSDGVTHDASHQARAGAAAPISTITNIRPNRLTIRPVYVLTSRYAP